MMIPVIRNFTKYLVDSSGYEATKGDYAIYAGILMASYSLFQFIFSPILGRLSDKYGRKPILLLSVGGNVLSYFFWAISNNFAFFLFSRIISGATGGNISVAQSYIADITSKSERAKYMGLVGAVFGIGFVVGPFFGGILSKLNLSYVSEITNNMLKFNHFSSVGIGMMFLSIISLIWIKAKVPETIKNGRLLNPIDVNHKTKNNQAPRSNSGLYNIFKLRGVGKKEITTVFLVFFIMSLGFVHVESILSWDLQDRFHLDSQTDTGDSSETGYFFAYMGIVMALVQGGLYRYLVIKFSLATLAKSGILILSFALYAMVYASPLVVAGIVIAIMAVGYGIANPSLMTMVSVHSGEDEQGVNVGIMQSLGAIARLIAPGIATTAYAKMGIASPYLIAGSLLLLCFTILHGKKIK